MTKKLFSIRDAKAEFYGAPFTQLTHAEAERSFTSLANDEKSTISTHAEDFDLYYLGTFEDVTGKLEILDSPQHIVKAVNLIKARLGAFNAVQ